MLSWHKTGSGFDLKERLYVIANRLITFLCLTILIAAAVSCAKSGEDPKDDPGQAPAFVLPDIDGKSMALADYRGKIVVLEFFATWCEPCKYTAPLLQALSVRYKDKGVVVLGVSIDEGLDVPVMLKAFMKENKLSYPVAIDNGRVKKQYNAYALPTTVIIDRDGRIAGKYYGIIPNYLKKLSSEIEQLQKP
jgi:peroxiredoxin